MKRVVLGVAALLAVIALIPASAGALGTQATCVVEGATGALSPSVQLQGGTGSFTFDGAVTCQVNGNLVPQGTIHADGTFNNSVCGTGTADGTATIPTIGNRTFHIQFIAGVGVVMVPDGALTHTAGAVQLLATGPDTSGPPGGNCVSKFTVVGAFSVD